MLEQAKRMLSGLTGRPVVAAVSGGLDSMCLLHLLHTWGREQGIAVTAAHFNHRLRGAEADRDEAFVRDWCAAEGIPFVCGNGDVRLLARERKLSLEEAAREARYAFLRQAAGDAPILTAHHADDNAETMLLNLLRGTGLRGITGIPAERDGILRPFLRITREELAAYAERYSVPHVEDSTNAEEDAARNVIRHRVLPVLKELNPGAVGNMARTAELLSRDEAVVQREMEKLLAKCRTAEDGLHMAAADCRGAESAVLGRCVQNMLARAGGHRKDIAYVHVEAVCGLLEGPPGKELHLPYGVAVRYDGEELLFCRGKETPAAETIRPGETVRFGLWRISLGEGPDGLCLSLPDGAELTVSGWDRNDRINLPGSRGSRSLKRLCADAGITPEQRDLLPVLRVDGKCAAVPGIGTDVFFAPNSHPGTVFVSFIKETEEN